MSPQEIDQMEAGPELDALIAEKIFNWTHLSDELWKAMRAWLIARKEFNWSEADWTVRLMRTPSGKDQFPLRHSTDISYAFLVAEEVGQNILNDASNRPLNFLMLSQNSSVDGTRKYSATFYALSTNEQSTWYERDDLPFTSSAPTASLAICRAALKTVI